jgi:undecaprenyl-diphosphatase
VACLFLLDPAIGRTEHQWPPAFVATADVFTRIGLGVWYVVPPLLWLCFANLVDWRALSRRRLMMFYNWSSLAFFMIIAVASSGLTSVLLKTVIGRARPLNYDQLGVLSFHPFMLDARFASFPSGHATVVGTVATLLVLLFPRWKYLVFPFAIWIASTRIFVGAHYPSDTVIGLGLGAGCTLALALIFARLGFIFVQRPNALPVRRDTFWIFGLPERQKRPSPATPSNAGHRPE